MSEMSNTNVCSNSMSEAGVYKEGLLPSKCPVAMTGGPGRHQATVWKKWSTQDNTCEMTCYHQSQLGMRGYRQRFHAFWKQKGLFQVEKRLCDQVQMIQMKGRLSQPQLEEIKRLVEGGENNDEAQQEEQNETDTEPILQVTEQHIAKNKEDEGRGEENVGLLINYNNIDKIEKKACLKKLLS